MIMFQNSTQWRMTCLKRDVQGFIAILNYMDARNSLLMKWKISYVKRKLGVVKYQVIDKIAWIYIQIQASYPYTYKIMSLTYQYNRYSNFVYRHGSYARSGALIMSCARVGCHDIAKSSTWEWGQVQPWILDIALPYIYIY